MSEKLKFKDLSIDDTFHLDKCNESGLIIDRGTPGRRTYRKTSARKYIEIDTAQVRQVGSVHASVWKVEHHN